MSFKNPKIQKFVSSLLILGIFAPAVILFSAPKKAEAFGPVFDFLTEFFTGGTQTTTGVSAVENTTSTAISVKNVALEVLRQVTMGITRRLLQEMTKKTINWINTGFHGNPLYLENPKSFFKDIAKTEVKSFIDEIGYNNLKYPFGKSFALDTIRSYKTQALDNAQYTLSKVINDPYLLDRYRNDFDYGGWNVYLINTQFPQNNYPGFQMTASDELARRLQGTSMTAAQEVQKTLDQGMGFLSPKTCPSNAHYNNTINEFKPPSYQPSSTIKWENFAPAVPDAVAAVQGGASLEELNVSEEDYQSIKANYDQKLAKAQHDFDDELYIDEQDWKAVNTCPGGLVTTTPGAVVASQIMNTMSSSIRQTELGAALGNSMSAILDALVNKLINTTAGGLIKLTDRSNTAPARDDWSYFGQTLGSPLEDGTNVSWTSGPDEEIVLADFKKEVADGIENTTAELKLLDNNSTTEPGITQMISQVWPKVRELDMCQPGPDLGWQDRLIKEMDRNSQKLQEEGNENDPEKAAAAQLTYKSLQYAVSSYKDWVTTTMMGALPSSILNMDEVNDLDSLYQESKELTDKKKAKVQTLGRLKAIQSGLATFATQPTPGSQKEKDMVAFRKQYNAIRSSISNSSSIEDSRNELALITDRYLKVGKMVTQCVDERKTKGWTEPYGRTSTLGNSTDAATSAFFGRGISHNDNEQKLFCDGALEGGYSHESFINNNEYVAYPAIPLVNGKEVLKYGGWPGLKWFSFGPAGEKDVNIELSCNIIYRAYIFDYKADLPGPTNIVELPPDGLSPGAGGTSGGGGRSATTCTAQGQQEREYMLPLLNGGTPPAQVASMTNSHFSLTTGGEAVYYSNNNTIGLPEFYLAGPSSSSSSQSWVIGNDQCTPGGSTTPSGPVNPPAGSLAPSQTTIVGNSPDVGNWAQTTTISSVNVPANGAISVNFDKKDGAGRWPDYTIPGWSGPIEYTIWLFENINGTWYGTGAIQMWNGRADTGAAPSGWSLYRQLQQNWVYHASPLSSHTLQSGEQVGFMVTAGNARMGNQTNTQERSNIYLVTLP